MGYPVVSPNVYEYLKKREGEVVLVSEITTRTGHSKEQILNALSNMRRIHGCPIETIIRGTSYRLMKHPEKVGTPAATTAVASVEKRVFDEIGITRDGSVIIQDQQGFLWKAQEI